MILKRKTFTKVDLSSIESSNYKKDFERKHPNIKLGPATEIVCRRPTPEQEVELRKISPEYDERCKLRDEREARWKKINEIRKEKRLKRLSEKEFSDTKKRSLIDKVGGRIEAIRTTHLSNKANEQLDLHKYETVGPDMTVEDADKFSKLSSKEQKDAHERDDIKYMLNKEKLEAFAVGRAIGKKAKKRAKLRASSLAGANRVGAFIGKGGNAKPTYINLDE